MKTNEINIRDPFVLVEDGKYYMYGTRAENFGMKTKGFDVYVSTDLVNWSEPKAVLNSESFGINSGANWAPEVHFYKGKYYMFATFTQGNGLRGTYGFVCDSPMGPFTPLSDKPFTPEEWECLDGTLYFNKEGKPYLVFCHEHTQIIDGGMCYVELKEDLTGTVGTPITMFHASEPFYIEKSSDPDFHYITDGPFLVRNSQDELIMFWSTFINGQYAECLAKSDNGDITGSFIHLEPLSSSDGGHGMVFEKEGKKYFTMHSPNVTGFERPGFYPLSEENGSFKIG